MSQGTGTTPFQGVHLFQYNDYGDRTAETVIQLPQGTDLPNCCSGSRPTGTVLSQVTTQYDVRHRPVARTIWLRPQA